MKRLNYESIEEELEEVYKINERYQEALKKIVDFHGGELDDKRLIKALKIFAYFALQEEKR